MRQMLRCKKSKQVITFYFSIKYIISKKFLLDSETPNISISITELQQSKSYEATHSKNKNPSSKKPRLGIKKGKTQKKYIQYEDSHDESTNVNLIDKTENFETNKSKRKSPRKTK